jgi:hypothetical protein
MGRSYLKEVLSAACQQDSEKGKQRQWTSQIYGAEMATVSYKRKNRKQFP